MSANFQYKWWIAVVLSIVVQLLFLRDLALFYYGFCFIYLWAIIKAPIETPPVYLILGGFVLGWLLDTFYNTHGMHAFSTVLVAWLRPTFFKILTPANGYDERSSISLDEMKWMWFYPYLALMLFTHHLALFLLEASDASLFGLSLLKALLSTLLGIAVFTLLELFNKEK
jgi:rod shape-determining protein MreD